MEIKPGYSSRVPLGSSSYFGKTFREAFGCTPNAYRARWHDCDTEGQAFSTAAYSLGCSAGNFSGGVLLEAGLHTLLSAGIAMALTGTILLFLTAGRQDSL